MPAPKIDFQRIAQAALNQAEQLVPAWLPAGKRDGVEWRVGDLSGAPGQSLAINLRTGVWSDFADVQGNGGADLISLYAAIYGLDQAAAARELGAQLGIDVPAKGAARKPARPAPKKAATEPAPSAEKSEAKSPWRPILPVPEGAPPPHAAHQVRGKPEATWCYRDASGTVLGYVYRFRTSDGGKEVLPHVYAEHEKTKKREWRWMSFPEPRPLYGIEHLREGFPVLVVEGEKCVDAARAVPEILAKLDVVSWPGGGKAVTKANWGLLAGRRAFGWPDCDAKRDKKTEETLPEEKQPGIKAMESVATALAARGAQFSMIKIPAPNEKPDGWDIADAIAEGMTGEQLLAFMRNLRPQAQRAEPKSRPAPGDDDWDKALIYKKGELAVCVANCYDILLHEPPWDGVLAFDEFAQRTIKVKLPPFHGATLGHWEAFDDTSASMWLSRRHSFTPSSSLVAESVEALARRFSYHPVRDWLRGLTWDGTDRVDNWLEDFCGAASTPYVRLVARWFLVGMVARVMQPGVKFDYCLVLEGTQGKGKSSALGILAGEWFGDTDLDLSNKDSMSALAGKWLYEFAELGALARAESVKQKSFLSRQVDHYRPVYGRREISVPRQCVFGGSTNEWEWNKDPTGGRRFWPIEVGDMDLDGLRHVREQLFAEALQIYLRKERFWPIQEQQRELFDPEQLRREQQEAFVDALHDWVYARVGDFSLADAAINGLKIEAGKITRDISTRIGTALRKLGCTRFEVRNGMTRYWYKPPEKSATSSDPILRAQRQPEHRGGQVDDDSIPF